MFARSIRRCAPPALERTIQLVAKNEVALSAQDLFRIAAVVAHDKHLGLEARGDFMLAYRDAVAALGKDAIAPFQKAQVDLAIHRGAAAIKAYEATPEATARQRPVQAAAPATEGTAGEAAAKAANPETSLEPVDHSMVDVDGDLAPVFLSLENASKDFAARHTYDARSVATACDELMRGLKTLTAPQLLLAIQRLSFINHQDFGVATRLSRRACELAPQISRRDACTVLLRLRKMTIQDSLVAVINRIQGDAAALTLGDCAQVVRSVEHQTNLTPHMGPLVAKVLYLMQGRVKEMDDRLLVAALDCAAKYDQRNAKAAGHIAAECVLRAPKLNGKQALTVLQAASNLGVVTAPLFTAVMQRATELCPTMDLRHIDVWLDVCSVLPFPSDAFMAAVMARLASDAGQLSAGQATAVVDILASYPPAKDHESVVSLAFAVKVRCEAYDRDMLAAIILGLCELHFRGEDLFDIADFFFDERHGFRHVPQLQQLLAVIDTTYIAAEPKVERLVAQAVHQVAPMMQPADLDALKVRLRELRLDDQQLQRKMQGRAASVAAHRAQREADREAQFLDRYGGQKQKRGQKHQGHGHGGRDSAPPPNKGRVQEAAAPKKKKEPFSLKRTMWDMDE